MDDKFDFSCECDNTECQEKVLLFFDEFREIADRRPRVYFRSDKCSCTDGEVIEIRNGYKLIFYKDEE